MSGRLNWDTDGLDWPNRAFSRFVRAGGLRWHVQVIGQGGQVVAQDRTIERPVVLLLHGTGASTHSWRALAPLLARNFTVVAPDLPGHGFSGTPAKASGFSLPAVASGIAELLHALNTSPELVAGHSAGAAVAARLCLDGAIAPDALISINGALLPFPGPANDLFGPVARLLAGSRLASRAFALLAGTRSSVARMLRSTGSAIDEEGVRLYSVLAENPVHVAGALGLMANWDLRPLTRDLPRLTTRLILVAGDNDKMVPPTEVSRVRALVPNAEPVWLHGLGHLAHEERPDEVAALLERLVVHETAV
jgi:magnesium chelatase accessory protein